MTGPYDDARVDFESLSVLIPKTKQGDDRAREELFFQIQTYMQLMAAKHFDQTLQQKVGASDIVQQTMAQVVEHFADFRGETGAEFRGWLKTIALNEMNRIRRTYRTAKRDVTRETNVEERSNTNTTPASKPPARTPQSEVIASEDVEKFYQALRNLPEHYAQIIQLRSIDQLPFDEIAKRLGKSVDSVTKLWYRAVLKFEQKLRETGNFDSQN